MNNIIISTQHTELTPALEGHVKEQFDRHLGKFNTLIHGNVEVTLKIDNDEHVAECKFHLKEKEIFSKEATDDMYASIDKVAKEVSRQTRQHKEKVQNHRNANKRNHAA